MRGRRAVVLPTISQTWGWWEEGDRHVHPLLALCLCQHGMRGSSCFTQGYLHVVTKRSLLLIELWLPNALPASVKLTAIGWQAPWAALFNRWGLAGRPTLMTFCLLETCRILPCAFLRLRHYATVPTVLLWMKAIGEAWAFTANSVTLGKGRRSSSYWPHCLGVPEMLMWHEAALKLWVLLFGLTFL